MGKSIIIYKAAPGAGYTDAQAETIGRRLEQLGQSSYRDISPGKIIADARKKSSPLNQFFEWDDSEAAARYRLWQARNIVNHLQIVIKTGSREIETKAYHSVVVGQQEGEVRVYRPTMSMKGPTEGEIRRQVLDSARRELASWRKRYAEYEDVFGPIFDEIDKVLLTLPNVA